MQPQGLLARDAATDALPGGGRVDTQAMLERELFIVARLAEASLNIALAIEAQAVGTGATGVEDAQTAPVPAPVLFRGDIALAFCRVSRAVRMALALQAKLIDDYQRWLEGRASAARSEAISAQFRRTEQTAERKEQVEEIVRRIADETFEDGVDDQAYEKAVAEAREKLADDDQFGDLLDRPTSEVIDLICRDLGLAPNWSRLAEEAWAREEARGGMVGAPLRSFHPDDREAEARSSQRRDPDAFHGDSRTDPSDAPDAQAPWAPASAATGQDHDAPPQPLRPPQNPARLTHLPHG